jgi:hypothetical protein
MSKRITAECCRSVLGVVENLLLDRARFKRHGECRFQVIDMNIQVDWRPMTFIVTGVRGLRRRLGAKALLE